MLASFHRDQEIPKEHILHACMQIRQYPLQLKCQHLAVQSSMAGRAERAERKREGQNKSEVFLQPLVWGNGS